jgi:membrane-bound lytic murein transglycosylase F
LRLHHLIDKQWKRTIATALAAVMLLPFLYSGQDTLTLLEKAQKRGSLTILTRNGASSYFIGPEGGTGPEYDLAAAFAEYLGLDLEVEVADEFGDLGRMLSSRQGELIAANRRQPDAHSGA